MTKMMECLALIKLCYEDYLSIDANIGLEETKGHVVNYLWRRPHGKEYTDQNISGRKLRVL